MSNANTKQVGGDHYKNQPIQAWDYIHSNGIGFLAGNVIKYVSRFENKGGLQDLEKALHYLEKLREEYTPKKEESQYSTFGDIEHSKYYYDKERNR